MGKEREDIAEAKRAWEEQVLRPALGRIQEREEFSTSSGIRVERLYTPEDTTDLDYLEKLGLPGKTEFFQVIEVSRILGRVQALNPNPGRRRKLLPLLDPTQGRSQDLLLPGSLCLGNVFSLFPHSSLSPGFPGP